MEDAVQKGMIRFLKSLGDQDAQTFVPDPLRHSRTAGREKDLTLFRQNSGKTAFLFTKS